MMRPFFSYYGAKWQGAKHYGPPRSDLVIEPFAGSACYSTRWCPQKVKLYDVSDDICQIWDFLISCSTNDLEQIPDQIHNDDLEKLPENIQKLLGFWIAKGRVTPSKTTSPWYDKYKNSKDCRVWGTSVKNRIIEQKPLIQNWEIQQLSYDEIPMQKAHWHVDPPYQGPPGRRYKHDQITFGHLSLWCRQLPGDVDVCENVGANWLPFKPLYSVVSSRGKVNGKMSHEAVWQKFTA